MNLDMSKLEPLLGTMVNELGAAANAALVLIGDKLGLFRALAAGAVTPAELAERTDTHERYVREWLSAQAASGFVTYDGCHDLQVLVVTRTSRRFGRRGKPCVYDRRFPVASGRFRR